MQRDVLRTQPVTGGCVRRGGGDADLDDAIMVVGQVWQWRPVLAQCVVAGVGVVVVVTVRNICRPEQTHGITSAAGKLP